MPPPPAFLRSIEDVLRRHVSPLTMRYTIVMLMYISMALECRSPKKRWVVKSLPCSFVRVRVIAFREGSIISTMVMDMRTKERKVVVCNDERYINVDWTTAVEPPTS